MRHHRCRCWSADRRRLSALVPATAPRTKNPRGAILRCTLAPAASMVQGMILGQPEHPLQRREAFETVNEVRDPKFLD
jgi:hypothetical protein